MLLCGINKKYIKGDGDMSKLCGFVWCYGNKDFEVWETDAISVEDQAKIEEILSKYDTTGTSERSAWIREIKDLFCEEY